MASAKCLFFSDNNFCFDVSKRAIEAFKLSINGCITSGFILLLVALLARALEELDPLVLGIVGCSLKKSIEDDGIDEDDDGIEGPVLEEARTGEEAHTGEEALTGEEVGTWFVLDDCFINSSSSANNGGSSALIL